MSESLSLAEMPSTLPSPDICEERIAVVAVILLAELIKGTRRDGQLTFAIPACTLAVYFSKHALIRLCRPFKAPAKLVFIDLIIMIDELCSFRDCIIVIMRRPQLVRMPSQIHVQRRHDHLGGMFPHDLYEPVVFSNESRHGVSCVGTVKPINLDHLFNEDSLAHNRSAKVKRKRREILPVSAHHFADGDFSPGVYLVASKGSFIGVYVSNLFIVRQSLLDHVPHRGHG